MGIFYNAGESKILPGIYQRYTTTANAPIGALLDGVSAIALSASWGDYAVHRFEKAEALADYYASGTASANNAGVEAAKALFAGGAEVVYAVRVEGAAGTLGTKGTANLVVGATNVVVITAKIEGKRDLKVKVSTDLTDAAKKWLTILDGSTILEKVSYAVSANERAAVIAALANSAYVVATAGADDGALAAQEVTLAGGTDPTPSVATYLAAFAKLESYSYNTLTCDQSSHSYNTAVESYLDEVYNNGKLGLGVVGEATTVAWQTRLDNVAAFNNEKIAYVASGFQDSDGNTWNGTLAVNYIAGVIASTPSSASITHKIIMAAVSLTEALTIAQREAAKNAGMITFSANASNQIWIDHGNNTLTNLTSAQDESWKKIRKVKTRFELFNRMDLALSALVGQVNNNNDGRSEMIQVGKNLLATMNSEQKILPSFDMFLDPDNPPTGDSVWFIISCYDYDSAELIYLHYSFRPEVA